MYRFWIRLRSAVRSSDSESWERIKKAIALIGVMAAMYWSNPEMRPRWPEFLSAQSLVSEDASDGATGWGLFGYGILVIGIVSVLLFSKEDHILHILIMLMAAVVFGALGFLYETFWGSHCPAWTFCTGAFQDMDDNYPQREDGYPVLPWMCRAEPETVGLR